MRLLPRFAARPRSAALCGLLIGMVVWSTPAFAGTHVVKPGESLWAVAKRYQTTVIAIRQATGLDSDQIRPGQKLIIPSQAKTEPRSAPKVVNKLAASKSEASAPTAAKESVTPPAAVQPRAAATRPAVTAQTRAAAERLYARDGLPAASSLDEVAPAWVLEPPGASTQFEKPVAARRGIKPCVAPDPGFGAFGKWVQVAPMAHVLATKVNTLAPDGGFDVLVHFHGREPIRKEWVQSMDRGVLVAVDVGIDSDSYADAFRDPRTLRQVLLAVESEIRTRTAVPEAHVRRLALSAWSAGYGAIEQLLKQPFARSAVESIILLDGLHVGYQGRSLDRERMAPFVDFAKQAVAGERSFFVSHSSISTSGYASSTETARYLIWKTGGRPKAVEALDSEPMGLERIALYNAGNFRVRGFRGNGASDHCAQLGLMRDVLRVHLLPSWQQPGPDPSRTPDAPPTTPPPAEVAPSLDGPSQLARLTSSSATRVQASP